jgi:hypothetical protein
LKHFQGFLSKYLCYKRRNDHFYDKDSRMTQILFVKKVRSGSGSVIPDLDPTWPKVPDPTGFRIRPGSGSDRVPDQIEFRIRPSSGSDQIPDPTEFRIRPSSGSDRVPDPTEFRIPPSSGSHRVPDPTELRIPSSSGSHRVPDLTQFRIRPSSGSTTLEHPAAGSGSDVESGICADISWPAVA